MATHFLSIRQTKKFRLAAGTTLNLPHLVGAVAVAVSTKFHSDFRVKSRALNQWDLYADGTGTKGNPVTKIKLSSDPPFACCGFKNVYVIQRQKPN